MPKLIAIVCALAATASAAEPLRLIMHGNMSPDLPDEEWVRFVERVRPDAVVVGAFEQRLYALAVPAKTKGKAVEPVNTVEHLAKWKALIDRLHKSGVRVIGQMELLNLTDRRADLTDKTGWFGYCEHHWDRATLGERPFASAAELVEEPDLAPGHGDVAVDTVASCGCRVSNKSLAACASKPVWRETAKRMAAAAIALGVDGFLTNRNYTGHCACKDCLDGFRAYLRSRHTPEKLKSEFGIADLDKADLRCVYGIHRDHTVLPDPLTRERLRFTRRLVKEIFDDVYLKFARSKKPDLILGQWNHMGFFDELHLDRGHLPPSTRTSFSHLNGDERWALEPAVWGKGEDLIWYCNWGTSQTTQLTRGWLGDTVLYGKLVRELAAGTPFTVNKYDFYRPRNMMAEAAAMGYVTNAIATPWKAEADRDTVARWFAFLRKHRALYDGAKPLSEVALLFPSHAVRQGDPAPVEYVEAMGRQMIRNHVLFDLLPDDRLAGRDLRPYAALIRSADTGAPLAESGPRFLVPPADDDRADVLHPGLPAVRAGEGERAILDARRKPDAAFAELMRHVDRGKLSTFDAPWTVEVHAYRLGAEGPITLHLVNYNRDEAGKGKAVVDSEAPIAAEPVGVNLRLPAGFVPKVVRFLSPDAEGEQSLEFRVVEGRIQFRTPGFAVYGVCVLGR